MALLRENVEIWNSGQTCGAARESGELGAAGGRCERCTKGATGLGIRARPSRNAHVFRYEKNAARSGVRENAEDGVDAAGRCAHAHRYTGTTDESLGGFRYEAVAQPFRLPLVLGTLPA